MTNPASKPVPTSLMDDRIFLVTRVVLAIVIVALLLAFAVLYFNPQNTKTYFAWDIKPQITAVFMGAGYIAGAFMFVYAVFGRHWHRVKNSLLPVSTFAAIMLVVTLLHYDRFIHGNLAFILWLIIYIITPFLVPWLWFHNRPTDPGTPEAGDKIVPLSIRWISGLVGAGSLLFWIFSFIDPPFLIAIWPWALTTLTAQVICAWGTLLSVGGLVLFREPRWSAWRFNIQAIALWQALMVIGSLIHRQDFKNGSLVNAYFICILLILALLAFFYGWMELHQTEPGQAVESTQPLL